MPEGGMSRARLRAHLRRCWAVYLVGAVAVLLLNNLIYTVTRPRASEEETLRVMLLNVDWEPDGGAQAALAEADIRLYGGASGEADAAVNALLSGNLGYDPDVHCSHHDHEHGEGGHTCGSHGCGGHSCH